MNMNTFVSIFGVTALLFSIAIMDAKPLRAADLTVEQALTVSSGLQQLSSYETTDKDGKTKKSYFAFSPEVRYAIATDIEIGRSVQTRFQTAMNDLIMKMSEGVGKVPDDKVGIFNVELAKLQQAPANVTFVRIKLSDLKLDDNPGLSGPTLSMLLPIVDR